MQHIIEHNLSNRHFLSDVLLVLGGYSVVHVIAQDFGMKTGINQRNLAQTEPVKFVLHLAAAYALLRNFNFSLLATILYYFLKYIYSRGITADRCTPDEDILPLKLTQKPEETGLPPSDQKKCGFSRQRHLKND